MALRPYLRPEYLSRIPIDGLPIEELGDVIGKVAVALHQLAESVKIGLDVVDLVIRDVLEQHYRERCQSVEADGPLALLPQPDDGEVYEDACTCEGGDVGLPHLTDCPLYLTARAPGFTDEDKANSGGRVLVLCPQAEPEAEDPDASADP